MSFGALPAEVARLDVLFGVVPEAAAVGPKQREYHPGKDAASKEASQGTGAQEEAYQ